MFFIPGEGDGKRVRWCLCLCFPLTFCFVLSFWSESEPRDKDTQDGTKGRRLTVEVFPCLRVCVRGCASCVLFLWETEREREKKHGTNESSRPHKHAHKQDSQYA